LKFFKDEFFQLPESILTLSSAVFHAALVDKLKSASES